MGTSALRCTAFAASVGVFAALASAQPASVSIVMKVGDPIGNDGGTVTGLGQPYVNSLGKAGWLVMLDTPPGGRAIWYDGAIIFEAFNSPEMPTGGEDTIGISNTGSFIYSPSVAGGDAVYTNFGTLLKAGDPLPNVPGFNSVFNSRPRMTDDGTAVWIGGYGPASSTTHRAMFRNTNPADPSATTIVFGTGDVIEGFTVAAGGPGFSYDISPSGQYFITPVTLSTGSTANDMAIVLNGTTIVAQEGSPNGSGDNWQNFGAVGINDSGNWVLAGDSSGPTATDGFLAYNGQIVLREGDTIDGVTLSGNCPALAIDNNNRVIFSWNPTASEVVFIAQAPDIAGTARVLARVGDEIDADGDGVADYTIRDFNGAYSIANAFDLSVNGPIYLNVDIREIGGTTDIEAIIAIDVGGPQCPADWDGNGQVNSTDISEFLVSWLSDLQEGTLVADFDQSGAVNSSDISAFLSAWLEAVQEGC